MTRDADDCHRCGRCCKRWGTALAGTIDDLYRWLEEERYDILQYCSARMNDGTVVCGAELTIRDLGDVYVVDLWKAPDGSSLHTCPFLSYDEQGLSLCTIHADKPSVCRNFTPIHGIITRQFLTARHTGRRRGLMGNPERAPAPDRSFTGVVIK